MIDTNHERRCLDCEKLTFHRLESGLCPDCADMREALTESRECCRSVGREALTMGRLALAIVVIGAAITALFFAVKELFTEALNP